MAKQDPVIIKNFSGGWNTEFESDFLDPSMSPDLENADFSASGSVKKETGYSELGVDEDSGVSYDLKVFPDRTGTQWLLKMQGEKAKLYDAQNGVFVTIKTGLTVGDRKGYEYFDDVIYVLSKVDTHFYIELVKITRSGDTPSAGATTLHVTSTAAFSSTGSFWYNNALVTYTGKTATSFTGCTGVPATTTAGSLVVGITTDMTSVSGIVKGNITSIFAGRLWIASGINSTVFASKLLAFDNFTVAGSGVGDAIQLTVESTATAMRVFYDDTNVLRLMIFSAENKIYACDVDDNASLSSTIVSKQIFKESLTALNQFSTLVGFNDLIHVDRDNQIRTLGQTYASQGVNKVYSDSVSENHKTLFKEEYNFEASRSVIFNNEYICACREGDGNTNNRLVMFDIKNKAWKKRTGINANDIAVFNNQLVFSDASVNKIFTLDGSGSDDGSNIYFKYSTPDLDTEKLRFERLRRIRIAGFISAGCELTVTAKSDFNTRELGNFTISGDNKDIVGVIAGKKGTFGTMLFGEEVFGGESLASNSRFFIADLELSTLTDLENFRIIVENNQANVFFKITAIKPFIMPQDEFYFPIKYILNNN